ncbi:helix-turn-helix transcriptional regulator [Mediterraneibacter glycyrrhizinilyticus]|uniref:helix-turn-helix transcriptional regulator n=1 Tax=Mediterraneibacter glycyrrhizinilyticus TaxID=342942 RepID=UPI0025A4206A|nr:WYL domain-containing protein [Mediterraneibacter glycyrrhizinilyticus]MDM8125841.1 WYL domain-containing protein [Mediterraneibacter glycyrrhizinilyticus]
MYIKQSKKMLIMNILDILKRYTDENHRLSQKEIMDILEREYEMKVERKAIKRNLLNLIEYGYQIEYSESIRINKRGEEESVYTDWYLVREFSDAELRLLIDSLLFSRHIPYKQCKMLIEKIENLSNRYFKSRVKHIQMLPDNDLPNRQLFYTIEILDQAITKGKQVSFHYNEYHTDKKFYPRRDGEGKIRTYITNPYQMAAVNGRYYLICNNDKYEDVSNYRIDRIIDIRLLDTSIKPMKNVKGLESGLNLPKHMAEHMYMFSGESLPVTFRAKKYLLTDLFDWFGKEMQFIDETEEEVTVRVQVNEDAMRKWALQYALHVKVIKPERLVYMIQEDIKQAARQYRIVDLDKEM